MTLSSMTGFARGQGSDGAATFEWEMKSVNAKGFDLRLRLPTGFDAIEQPLRQRAAQRLSRGTVYANLTLKRSNAQTQIRINEDVLNSVLRVAQRLSQQIDAVAPSIDGLLSVKGVVDLVEESESEETLATLRDAVQQSFDATLNDLVAMREREGDALGAILRQRLDELETLAARAESAPGRKPEAVRARLAQQIAALLDTSDRFDADRLHQEAVLIAARADIREELDRIASHIAQGRAILSAGGAVGRKLDFLAQEFNREVNTCCSKSGDIELTAVGMEMKSVVEQFREQVQNLE